MMAAMTASIVPKPLSASTWSCRESNPGPDYRLTLFYGRSSCLNYPT